MNPQDTREYLLAISGELHELNEKLERQHWVLESIADSLLKIAEQTKKGVKVDVLR